MLGKFRDGVVDVSPEAVTVILKCLDCVRDLLSQLEETGEEPEGEDQALIDELNAMADGDAASSGQEPYSLAIILKEAAAKLQGWRVKIVGTEISKEILAKAKAGLYSQFEVQHGLPIQMLVKYFEKKDDLWLISQELRDMVTFREFNLLTDLKPLGKFDVVSSKTC